MSKLDRLEELLDSLGLVAVAFSGGADSTFLAAVCARCIPRRTLLIHLATPLVGTPERQMFEAGVAQLGLPTISLPLDTLACEDVAANPSNRCYLCKRAGFSHLVRAARSAGHPTVLEGSNADDAHDYRPGMRAVQELGVRSPLAEVGFRKEEERELLHAWGFPVWNLPSGACLATRIPTGEALTKEKLDTVRACEDYLHDLGLRQVRVRLSDGCAQVAADPADLARLAELRACEGGRARSGERGDRLAGEVADVAQGVALPTEVIDELLSRGAAAVNPVAHPYRQGAMNEK